ncbi:hypothetical protein [Paenibacillus taichungensis]|uniref:hypothetical protein n=1 Tax=Paenibacillus taichungensis TaxID=484184 RepID=UPI0009A2BC18|nr:hypothetical protein B2I21_09910 [Chryseobacterium mucoviscidosis]
MTFEYRPYSKSQQTGSKRIKPTQRQMGDIRKSVDKSLKKRSGGVCEACGEARATERAHLTGRKQLDHRTEVYDLAHLCKECHVMLDETIQGLRFRRMAATIIASILK